MRHIIPATRRSRLLALFAVLLAAAVAVVAVPAAQADERDEDAQAQAAIYTCVIPRDGAGCDYNRSISGYVHVATMFQHPYGDGWRIRVYANAPCTEPTSNHEGWGSFPTFPDGTVTNNRVSSVDTYRTCDVKLWDGEGETGSSTGYIHQCSRLSQIGVDCAGVSGNWDNRASSFRIS